MLKDTIISNRSTRGYDHSRTPSREELLDMVDCARLSPASMNVQSLKYLIVTDENQVAVIRKGTVLGGRLKERHLPDLGKEPPAYIVILKDQEIQLPENFVNMDVGIAAEAITLSATEKGYNGCMLGSFNPVALAEALNIPDRYLIKLVIAIGKSAEEIHLVDIAEGESIGYYRDENDVHYVPKRKLQDIVLEDMK
ncbi:MAG: nitroreductase family protein [Eubacteriales bacterium]|nr:nitroreductase family protein [Eubacteriales bacterium]